jgi:cytochrome c
MRTPLNPGGRPGRLWAVAAVLLLTAACAGEPIRPTPVGSPAARPPATASPAASLSPAAVAAAPAAPSPSPAPAGPAAASPAGGPAAGGPTAGGLAQAGQAVYAQHCGICHGDQGQGLVGPAVIGPRAALSKYGSGQGLLEYTTMLMPQTAPGSLPPEQYLQVTTYLLVQNGLLPPEAPVGGDTLATVQLP